MNELKITYDELTPEQKTHKFMELVSEHGVKLDDSSVNIIKDLMPKQGSWESMDNSIPYNVSHNESVLDYKAKSVDNPKYVNTGHDYPMAMSRKP
jgi:hypothetical protein